MKTKIIDNFVNYVNLWETKTKDLNKQEYKNSVKHDVFKNFAELYLENVGGKEVLRKCVDDAIKRTNNVLQILSKNNIMYYFAHSQIIARIIEYAICESIELENIKFKHGLENKNDKDLECVNISNKIKSKFNEFVTNNNIKFDFKNNDSYGIEIKTTSTDTITGNKSYALNKGGKSKDSFYILVNYKTDPDIRSSDFIDKLKIASFESYFGYIEQFDWMIKSENSNSASLNMKTLKEKRLIEL